VPKLDRGDNPGAAAERIVAFARPGKPPISVGLGPHQRRPKIQKNRHFWLSPQWFLKHVGLSLTGQEIVGMAGTKKRDVRKSLQQPGWITLDGGFAARPCLVQDMSASGAKVTIDDPNVLPTKLRLGFSRDARTGRSCEVVWRRGKSLGVKFVR
jgi:hypothetical protein